MLITILTACNGRSPQSVKSDIYISEALKIGIIGETPKVSEKQIKFVEIQFTDLDNSTFDSQYDAIFITKDNLTEAAGDKYASIYKESKIPFFFIQTEKGHIPFTEEELSYEEAPEVQDQSHATGIIVENNKLKYWTYGLYNDIENEDNVKDVYTRIFETINKIKMMK
jgi:hypothetical protein